MEKAINILREKIKADHKDFISYGEFINRVETTESLREENRLVYKKSYFKIGLGCVCLAVAVFPNGLGFIFYPLGFMLLVNGGFDLMGRYKKIKNRVLNKLRLLGLLR